MDSPTTPLQTLNNNTTTPTTNASNETVTTDNSNTNTNNLNHVTTVTPGNKTNWKMTFLDYTKRFVVALATLATLAALFGAGYAALTIGIFNPLTLIVGSAASLALLVGLIAYGIYKLSTPDDKALATNPNGAVKITSYQIF